jgi:hypothetical protein
MTQTAPQPGFLATLLKRTGEIFLAQYDRAITVIVAAFFSFVSLYGAQWFGALPPPSAPSPQAPVLTIPVAPPPPPRTDPALAARLDSIDAALKGLKDDLATARSLKRAPPK